MKATSEQPPGSAFAAAARSRHGAGLRRYVAGLLGGPAARAEAVAEAALTALAAVPAGEVAEAQAAEWLFRHARERALADLRHEGLMARFDESAAPAPDEAADDADVSARVRRAIERLTPKQEEVLRLKFVHGFGFASLAEIIGLPASQAGHLLHQAISRIGREAGLEGETAGDGAATADARLTAFALGEMSAAEKTAWMTGWSRIPGGKARSDAWSVLCGQIGRALASDDGAARRRRRAAGAGGRARRRWLVAAAVLLVGAAGWWWAAREDADAEERTAGRGMRAGAAKVVVPVKAKTVRLARPVRPGGVLVEAAGEADHSGPEARTDRGARRGAAAARPARPEADAAPDEPGAEISSTTEEEEPAPDEAELLPGAESDRADVVAPPAERRGRVGQVGRETPAAPGAPAAGEVRAEAAAEFAAGEASEPKTPPAIAAEPASPARAGATRPTAEARARTRTPRAATPKEAAAEAPTDDPATDAPPPPEVLPAPPAKKSGQPPPARARRVGSPAAAATADATVRAEAGALALSVEAAEAPWAPERRLVRVTARARPLQPPSRPAAGVVFLLDVSDSMAEPNRFPLVQAAVGGVVDRLRPEDRVSVVTYAGDSRVALPPAPAAQPAAIHAVLAGLTTGGRTNGGAGLAEATALARAQRVPGGVNWVIWCTDGDFNVGASTEEELGAMIDRAAADGVRVAIFGFGRNGAVDPRLEALAARAGGGSGYVNTRREAEVVFASRLPGLFAPAARAVRLAVEFTPTEVAAWRRAGEAAAVGWNQPEPLEEELLLPGQTMTALFEVAGAGGDLRAATVRVRASYETARDGAPAEQGLAAGLGGDWARAAEDFKLAAAVEGIERAARGTAAARAAEFAAAEAWGRAALTGEAGGYRREFLALVERWKLARGTE